MGMLFTKKVNNKHSAQIAAKVPMNRDSPRTAFIKTNKVHKKILSKQIMSNFKKF